MFCDLNVLKVIMLRDYVKKGRGCGPALIIEISVYVLLLAGFGELQTEAESSPAHILARKMSDINILVS